VKVQNKTEIAEIDAKLINARTGSVWNERIWGTYNPEQKKLLKERATKTRAGRIELAMENKSRTLVGKEGKEEQIKAWKGVGIAALAASAAYLSGGAVVAATGIAKTTLMGGAIGSGLGGVVGQNVKTYLSGNNSRSWLAIGLGVVSGGVLGAKTAGLFSEIFSSTNIGNQGLALASAESGGGILDKVQDWLARSNKDYQAEVVARLNGSKAVEDAMKYGYGDHPMYDWKDHKVDAFGTGKSSTDYWNESQSGKVKQSTADIANSSENPVNKLGGKLLALAPVTTPGMPQVGDDLKLPKQSGALSADEIKKNLTPQPPNAVPGQAATPTETVKVSTGVTTPESIKNIPLIGRVNSSVSLFEHVLKHADIKALSDLREDQLRWLAEKVSWEIDHSNRASSEDLAKMAKSLGASRYEDVTDMLVTIQDNPSQDKLNNISKMFRDNANGKHFQRWIELAKRK
jgi:hypothetical protein